MSLFGGTVTLKFSSSSSRNGHPLHRGEARQDQRARDHAANVPWQQIGGIKIEIDTSRKNPAAASQPATRCRRLFTAITKIKCRVTFSPKATAEGRGPQRGHGRRAGELSAVAAGRQAFFDHFRVVPG